jgi:hypothetical protein
MSKAIRSLCLVMGFLATPALAGGGACTYSDLGKLKEHLEKHVKYPASGKVVKQTCRAEMPDEFTADELKCSDAKLSDSKTYKSAAEVMKALGV